MKKRKHIHFELDEITNEKWKYICEIFQGNTRTAVFRNLVEHLYRSLNEPINFYDDETGKHGNGNDAASKGI